MEADVADRASRALILEHNIDNGNKGFTSLEQHSGSGMNETLGAFNTYNSNYNAIPDYHGYVSILSGSTTSEGRGINLIGQKDYANIRFFLGGVQNSDLKMILSSNGHLGIGSSTPKAKLHISDGDVYIENINNGVIMRSPNGNCWRMTIDNSGVPMTTALGTCP